MFLQCELQHWVDVMDKFDDILASVAKPVNGSSWILTYDKLDQLEGPDIAVSIVSWASKPTIGLSTLRVLIRH